MPGDPVHVLRAPPSEVAPEIDRERAVLMRPSDVGPLIGRDGQEAVTSLMMYFVLPPV